MKEFTNEADVSVATIAKTYEGGVVGRKALEKVVPNLKMYNRLKL